MSKGAQVAGVARLRLVTAIEWPRRGAYGSRIGEPADRRSTAHQQIIRGRMPSSAKASPAPVCQPVCVRCAADSLRSEPFSSRRRALRTLRLYRRDGRGRGTALVAVAADRPAANAVANGQLQLSQPADALVVRAGRAVLFRDWRYRAVVGAAGSSPDWHGAMLASRAYAQGPLSRVWVRSDRQHQRSMSRVRYASAQPACCLGDFPIRILGRGVAGVAACWRADQRAPAVR